MTGRGPRLLRVYDHGLTADAILASSKESWPPTSSRQWGDNRVSLTSILKGHPDIARRLAALVKMSAIPAAISEPPRAPPRTKNYPLVGTAFDYLLRFEIERRCPDARTQPWVAEESIRMLAQVADAARRALKKRPKARIRAKVGEKVFDLDPRERVEIAEKARRTVKEAQASLAQYTESPRPTAKLVEEMAAHALRLASLDSVYRAGRVDIDLNEPDPEDIRDLVAILGIAPFDVLDPYFRTGPVLLNPTFGRYSRLVGGADADIVAGGVLLDVKTTNYPEFGKDLAQILGYAILADHHRLEEPSFPEVREIGFYFSRHGTVEAIAYGPIRKHRDFRDAVDALFGVAREEYGEKVSDR